MTLPIGTKVMINLEGQYPSQGKLNGDRVVGRITENSHDENWPEAWRAMKWNVKVVWPYQEKGRFNLYSAERDLVALVQDKNFKNYL